MQITITPQGNARIQATMLDGVMFATRPRGGAIWPASVLRGCSTFEIEIDPLGDLVDFRTQPASEFDNVPIEEVTAFIEYALWEARSQIDELLTIEERKHAGGRA